MNKQLQWDCENNWQNLLLSSDGQLVSKLEYLLIPAPQQPLNTAIKESNIYKPLILEHLFSGSDKLRQTIACATMIEQKNGIKILQFHKQIYNFSRLVTYTVQCALTVPWWSNRILFKSLLVYLIWALERGASRWKDLQQVWLLTFSKASDSQKEYLTDNAVNFVGYIYFHLIALKLITSLGH